MAGCSRVPWTIIRNRPTACGCSCLRSDRYVSQHSEAAQTKPLVPKGQVTIPMKKKRDSLSVLKALASTVEPVKGPAYHNIDDPYMMTHRGDMFQCYYSRAAGQKTARYFVNKYRSAFEHDDMAPFVQAFQPDNLEYQHSTLCDDAIRERIQRRETSKAVEVYEKMKQQGMEVSEAVKLELLELMCMFGSRDPPEKKLPLEMVFYTVEKKDPPSTTTVAMDVYNDLSERTEEAQNWMLQGFLMSSLSEQAITQYKEMKANKVPVYQNSYHEMLKKAGNLAYLTNSKVNDTILGILREMAIAEMQATLTTFNSVITGMTRSPFFFLDFFPKILAEMKELDIEPDYEMWTHVMLVMLNCLPNKRRDVSRQPSEQHVAQMQQYIEDSIQHITAHPQEIYCSSKGNYFEAAMQICHYMQDSELALQLHELKDSLGHKYISTNFYKEEDYHFHMFDLLGRTEPCQKILDIYNKTYGHMWLGSSTMMKVLASVDMFKEYQHLPMLFEDFMSRSQRYPDKEVLQAMLSLMALDGHPEELKESFKVAALHVYNLMRQYFDPQRKRLSGSDVAEWAVHPYLIKIFVDNGDLEAAWECFMTCHQNQDLLNKFTWNEALHPLLDAVIDAKDQSRVETFVAIADIAMNHAVDIKAYRPKLEMFMTAVDIDAMQKGQRERIKKKYNL